MPILLQDDMAQQKIENDWTLDALCGMYEETRKLVRVATVAILIAFLLGAGFGFFLTTWFKA